MLELFLPMLMQKKKSESKEVMKMKDVVVPWKIKADKKFENAIELHLLGERPNLNAFHCELRSERELQLIWDD